MAPANPAKKVQEDRNQRISSSLSKHKSKYSYMKLNEWGIQWLNETEKRQRPNIVGLIRAPFVHMPNKFQKDNDDN